MKKSYSLLSCFALFLLALVLCCKPVKAAEPTVINLSDLDEDCYLELKEDSILNLDTDKTIHLVYLLADYGDHELTITGNGKLTCEMIGMGNCSGKIIVESGTIVCIDRGYLGSIYGDGSLIVNGGSITLGDLTMNNITINGGNISARRINCYASGSSIDTSSLSIYGGHVEVEEDIVSKEIYIDDKMFVVEPWDEVPLPNEPYDSNRLRIGTNEWRDNYGVKIMPKSEVVSLDGISLNGISLNETSCTLTPGENKQLSVNFSPENATNKGLKWTSSDSTIVSVDQYTGEVKALRPGKAVITVLARGGKFTESCEVTVENSRACPDGLVIEASNFYRDVNTEQPYIRVKYNGVELKEGSDYVINKETNWDTGLSTTTITGLDEYIRKVDEK